MRDKISVWPMAIGALGKEDDERRVWPFAQFLGRVSLLKQAEQSRTGEAKPRDE